MKFKVSLGYAEKTYSSTHKFSKVCVQLSNNIAKEAKKAAKRAAKRCAKEAFKKLNQGAVK